MQDLRLTRDEDRPESGRSDRRSAAREISAELKRIFKEVFGRGPEHVRVEVSRHTALCLLEGGLTSAERALVSAGQAAKVSSHRAALHDVVRDELVTTVSSALDRRVRTLLTACEPEQDVEVLVFALEPEPRDDGADDARN